MDVDERLTRLEERFEAHVSRAERQMTSMENLHRENKAMIDRLDGRMDRNDVVMARLFAGIAGVILIANLIAPVVLPLVEKLAGVPS